MPKVGYYSPSIRTLQEYSNVIALNESGLVFNRRNLLGNYDRNKEMKPQFLKCKKYRS